MTDTTRDTSSSPAPLLPQVTDEQADSHPAPGSGSDDSQSEDPGQAAIVQPDDHPTPADPSDQAPGHHLFQFAGGEPAWYTVNDNVMGGISTSQVDVDTERRRLSFSGSVSLENNGGFASIRSEWTPLDLGGFDGIVVRVRGDGNVYRFRIRTEENGRQGIAYTRLFETEADTWQEIFIPFSKMAPLFRGYLVESAGPLNPASIRSFGFMVSDKQQGEFNLEVDWISAVVQRTQELAADDAQSAGDGGIG